MNENHGYQIITDTSAKGTLLLLFDPDVFDKTRLQDEVKNVLSNMKKTENGLEHTPGKPKMLQNLINRKMLIAAAVLLVISFFGVRFFVRRNATRYEIDPESAEAISLKMAYINDVIREHFYFTDDYNEEAVYEGAYRGMVDALGDKYSKYYNAEEAEKLLAESDGVYLGTGIYLRYSEEEHTSTVLQVLEGSPAVKAGVEEGDYVLAVDGVSVKNTPYEEVTPLLRGEEGTEVNVLIRSRKTGMEREVSVRREWITIISVHSKMLEDNIGYIWISEFTEQTHADFLEAYARLLEQGMERLILDLRNNPGGAVSSEYSIGDFILPAGETVYEIYRDGTREAYVSDENEIGIPYVVLINQYSASAAESLAGAIKSFGKSTVIGMQSFGKGITQQYYELPDGTFIKITASEYYPANGEKVHKIGIIPDEEIALDEEAYYKVGEDNQLARAIELVLAQ